MAETTVRAWYADEMGHVTGSETWSSTLMSLEAGYLLQGDEVDCSDPDRGIIFRRSYVSYVSQEEGELFEVLPDREVVVLDRGRCDRAVSIEVNGLCVLVRASGDERADFDCGLRWFADEAGGE